MLTTALGQMAALAWNRAIQRLFTETFGEAGDKLVGQLFCAILITLVVIYATISVRRAAERAKKAREERNGGLLETARRSREGPTST